MNVDPTRLLRRLGSSIADTPSGVKGKRRWTCPLHQDSDKSLSAGPPPDVSFSCDNPVCRFRGDAVSLVSLARKITLREALDLFRPGGEFSDCLAEPLRTEEAEAYLETAHSQASLKAYLARCRQALRRCPEKAGIRPGMSMSSAKLLHPDVGLFLDTDVPPVLSEFQKPKYRRSNLVLYPYTRDGEITRIEVLDTTNPVFRHTVVVTHPGVGVFGEDAGEERQIIAVERPEIAALLYATHALNSTKRCPVAAFQGYPLPESFANVSTIHILSTVDMPASTEFLLHTMSVPEVRRGKAPVIRVHTTSIKSSDLTFKELETVRTAGEKPLRDIQYTVAQRFADMVRHGQDQMVLELLSREQTPAIVRNMIRDEAENQLRTKGGFGDRESTEALVRLIDGASYVPSSTVTLANGRTVERKGTGLYAVNAKSGHELLCNVGLSVDSKIVSGEGDEIYSCSVTHSDDVPVVGVRLSERDLTPDRMRSAVMKAYSARGCSPYVAFYSVTGVSWRDLVPKLAEHCPVSREISELGIDSASNVNLPEACIRADGTVVEQSNIFTMPDNVVRMYSGIPLTTDAGVWPYTLLLEQCDNLFVAAFTLGLMHVVYQMTYGVFKPSVARNHMMRHLFYVETEPGIWQAVFRQLAGLFSGCDFTPTVNYANPMSTLEEYARLGCLPLIAYVPTMGAKFASALDSTKSDVIGLVDSSTAVMTNGKVSATYVMPMDERDVNYNVIDGRVIDSLRKSFVPFLVKFIREAKIDTSYRASSMPCIAAYDEACRILGVQHVLPHDLVMNYFPGIGMTGVDILFDMLHRLLVDESEPRICVVNGTPQPGYSFTRRGQHVFLTQDYALVSNAVLDIVHNAFPGKPKFNVDQLVSDMSMRGMLYPWLESGLDVDRSRCFLMKRETWEMKVVRPPINLNAEVKNGTIDLQPVIREPVSTSNQT